MTAKTVRSKVGDSVLNITIASNDKPPLVFLNGAFGTSKDWLPTLDHLGGRFSTVLFDARGRGRSQISNDYSIDSAAHDVAEVVGIAGMSQPIVVGWSHGATLAVLHAAAHPDDVAGLVLIDGGYPVSVLTEAMRKRVRSEFRKMRIPMRVLAWLGRGGKMSASEAADIVIEVDRVNGLLEDKLANLKCPIVFVVGSGAHYGATSEEMLELRAAAGTAATANSAVSLISSAENHLHILNRDPKGVVAAIDKVFQR